VRLARLVVEDGRPVARAAERLQVAWPTATRWADRCRVESPTGMTPDLAHESILMVVAAR
jgi:hypothetical protein